MKNISPKAPINVRTPLRWRGEALEPTTESVKKFVDVFLRPLIEKAGGFYLFRSKYKADEFGVGGEYVQRLMVQREGITFVPSPPELVESHISFFIDYGIKRVAAGRYVLGKDRPEDWACRGDIVIAINPHDRSVQKALSECDTPAHAQNYRTGYDKSTIQNIKKLITDECAAVALSAQMRPEFVDLFFDNRDSWEHLFKRGEIQGAAP